MNSDLSILIHRWHDGAISDEEMHLLSEVLGTKEGRAALRREWFLDAALVQALRASPVFALLETIDAAPEASRFTRDQRIAWRPLALAAAVVTFAILIVSLAVVPQAEARPVALVKRALETHNSSLDRCYQIEGRSRSSQRARLWTRGDRFWVETRADAKSAVWGQDEQGRVWFTVSRELGAQFDGDEVPARLAEMSTLRSLQVPSLLKALLDDFDLTCEPNTIDGYIIRAKLKDGHDHPRYRAAVLEIDSASGALRRLEVDRVSASGFIVPVTFTLVETGHQEDAKYTLVGHLSESATVYDRSSSVRTRGRLLAEFMAVLRAELRSSFPSTSDQEQQDPTQ